MIEPIYIDDIAEQAAGMPIEIRQTSSGLYTVNEYIGKPGLGKKIVLAGLGALAVGLGVANAYESDDSQSDSPLILSKGVHSASPDTVETREATAIKDPYFKPGVQVLEATPFYNAGQDTLTIDHRSRLITNVEFPRFDIGYFGFHEIDGSNPNAYNTWNAFQFGNEKSLVRGITVLKYMGKDLTGDESILTVTGGFRNTTIPTTIGEYGFLDLTGNDGLLSLDFFMGITADDIAGLVGLNAPDGLMVETLQAFTSPFSDMSDISHFIELQLNQNVIEIYGTKLDLMVRA